jgi:RNA polymerase sigma-70 factor (ECF subfamily)
VNEISAAAVLPASVVQAAVEGDVMAFARIVRAHHDDMARVCRVICGDPDAAQDAAQAAWPIAWQKLRTLREPARLRPWLISIAVNEARQQLRREHRGRVVNIDVADLASHDHDPANRVTRTDLLAAIRRLPVEDRELLSLRYVAGFDATQIGAMLGMSASGIRSRLARLVDRLRKEVDDG